MLKKQIILRVCIVTDTANERPIKGLKLKGFSQSLASMRPSILHISRALIKVTSTKV